MKTVGILNAEGIKSFREFLNRLRSDENLSPRSSSWTAESTPNHFLWMFEVTNRNFSSRSEAAEYFTTKFDGLRDVHHGAPWWAWLTLFYFDQVCLPTENGIRTVGAEARYIPGSRSWRYYRHRLAGPFRIYQLYGQNSKLLLTGPFDKPGDFPEHAYQNSKNRRLTTRSP
jgi:hypothetical protein